MLITFGQAATLGQFSGDREEVKARIAEALTEFERRFYVPSRDRRQALVDRFSAGELSEEERRNFNLCLLLGTDFGATIGGVATLVGTPPNAFLAAFLAESYDIEISFARWMLVGVPVTAIMLPLCWLVLTRLVYPIAFETSPETQQHLKNLKRELGPASSAEWRVGIVFACVVIGWMTRPWLTKYLPIEGLSDPGIVMIAAFAMFLIPSGGRNTLRLLNWQQTKELPWEILILFGGGLSLAPIETGLSFIKVLYVVAPLLGLLGTVVGMIATFQMITLFGTGDPRMMAGGISTALVTTVLGLTVAIPLTLLHSFLQGKSKALIQTLEEQAAGIIARLAERSG